MIDAIFLQAERTYNHGIILRVDEVNGLFIFYIVKKMCFFFYENLGINGENLCTPKIRNLPSEAVSYSDSTQILGITCFKCDRYPIATISDVANIVRKVWSSLLLCGGASERGIRKTWLLFFREGFLLFHDRAQNLPSQFFFDYL